MTELEFHPIANIFPLLAGDEYLASNKKAHLHKRFSACRRHGEWFEATEELLELIGGYLQ